VLRYTCRPVNISSQAKRRSKISHRANTLELFFLKLVVFSRPLISVRYGEEFFSLVGIALFGTLLIAVAIQAVLRKSFRVSAIDFFIFTFALWCIARSAIYADLSTIRELMKLLIPLLSFTVVKNIVSDRGEYNSVLFWMIVGFVVPVLLSGVQIALRRPDAIAMTIYFTGIDRWQGAYLGAHSLGHSMTLFLFVIVIYVLIRQKEITATSRKLSAVDGIFISVLGFVALYNLYMSEVRSAVLGLLVFVGLLTFRENKKLFFIGGASLTLIGIILAPVWIPVLLHEFAPDRKGGALEVEQMGSGRPTMWLGDYEKYLKLPIDQKIMGIGPGKEMTSVGEFKGHNDWLRILWDTGVVGFTLFLLLQISIVMSILRMKGTEKNLYLSLFTAVMVMMVVSNSYNLRIQVSHLYYILLAYVELPNRSEQSGGYVRRNKIS